MSLDDELLRELDRIAAADLRRHLRPPATSDPRRDFATSDTLGLAGHPSVLEAACRALREHGVGGRAARLLGGGSSLEAELEAEAAAWLDAEACLLFPSGYQANLGVLGALAGPGDAVLSDELNHASIIDGARLSRARVHTYPHLDLERLERTLGSPGVAAARRRLVVTESVFSMDGDLAPLAEICRLCARHDAALVVDEAHAAGLLGPRGAGAWPAADVGRSDAGALVARIITGGKALGVSGALVAGSAAAVDLLVNRARAFIFTTATSPAVPAALRAAIELVQGSPELRRRALDAASRLAEALDAPAPAAAIVPAVIGPEEAALAAAEAAREEGFDVRAVRPPTVPPGTARLRLVARAAHRPDDLERLAALVRPHMRTPGPVSASRRPPRPLLVCGTDTDIGKTVCSALLLRAARRCDGGAYWKPVQTGPDSDTAEVARLAGVDLDALPQPAWSLPLPASPHEAAADAGVEIDPAALSSALAEHRRRADPGRLIVELAGGLQVPLTDDFTQLDWIARERPDLVLVARSGLGTLNHTLLSVEALRRRHLEPAALLVVGPPHSSNRSTLARLTAIPRVLELPELSPLSPEALAAWLDRNPLDDLVAGRS